MATINDLKRKIQSDTFDVRYGVIKSVHGSYAISTGPLSKVGDILKNEDNDEMFKIISCDNGECVLLPLDGFVLSKPSEKVFPSSVTSKLPVDINELLGNVIDAFGNSLIDKKINRGRELKQRNKVINPMTRKRITKNIETGVKTIDGLLTIGRGQRIGIFAGTGVGKSTILSMIARKTKEDVNVIALIGERGREVREFIERDLGDEGLKRSVIVVSTSDESPVKQEQAAQLATTIAEQFRDQGKNVLLMMDSITRYANAKRSMDMAAGEIPMLGGKTPSIEPALQKILERAGNDENGSITGIYSVLVEGDDLENPIVDMARGILDGHIVLDRKLANQNIFPAINVNASISRVMEEVVSEDHWQLAKEFKKIMGTYEINKDQIELGLVEENKNKEIDRAIRSYPRLIQFMRQDISETYRFIQIINEMKKILQN